jgi:hypothetical protein
MEMVVAASCDEAGVCVYSITYDVDTRISLRRGPFTSEGNLESGGGLTYWGQRMMNQ